MTELEDLQGEYREDLEKHEVLLKAWEKVTFLTKKDGTPFDAMQRNISGAVYKNPADDSANIKINDCRFSDTIYCEAKLPTTNSTINNKAKEKPQNVTKRKYGDTYIPCSYVYDLDDIKEAIMDRIEYLKGCIESEKNVLKRLPDIWQKYDAQYSEMQKELISISKELNDEYLYSTLLDAFHENYS